MSPALKQLLEKLFLNSRTLSVSPAIEIKKKVFVGNIAYMVNSFAAH